LLWQVLQMQPGLAEALTRSLSCGAWPLEGRVSVYVSYSDETGSADGKGHFLVAGYGASEKEWPEFAQQWSEQIIQSTPRIPYLHMVEIRSRAWREKIGITKDEADEKVRRAVKLILSTAFLEPYIGTLNEVDYAALKKFFLKKGYSIPRHQGVADIPCFFTYAFSLIHNVAVNKPNVRRINFVISNKQNVEKYIQRDVREAMIAYFENTSPHLATLFGDVIPLSMVDHMPLQAADVLCWHLQRKILSVYTNEEEKENVAAFINKGICGLELTNQMLNEISAAILLKAKREEKHGSDADVFASTVSRLLRVPKSEVMEAMEKQDKSLKRKKPK